MYKKKKDILVLHTSDVGFWLGINRVGTVNADIEANNFCGVFCKQNR